MTERVVVTQGSTTTEFTYSGYKDWNNPLNKIGVLHAGKIVERRNGAVVRDLTTDVTETGNVYVVAPVPPSVQAAIKPIGQIPRGGSTSRKLHQTRRRPRRGLRNRPDWQLVSMDWIETTWETAAPMRSDAGETP
jgi:hypothetical protein